MLEQDLYSGHLQPCLSRHGHCCRVENTVGGGMPDVNYAIDQVHGWLELKVIHQGLFHFEKFQLPWLRQRAKHSRDIWVLALHEGLEVVRLYTPAQLLACELSSKRKWTVIKSDDPDYVLELPLKGDWSALVRKLTHAT